MGAGATGGLDVALIGTGAIEIPPKGYGAVEDYIANLARELTVLGHRVTVLNRLTSLTSRPAREFLSALALPIDLRGRRFDILHAQSPITAEALFASGHPYVFTSHSRYWLSKGVGLDRLWRSRDRGAVRRASAVVALSSTVRPIFDGLRLGQDPDRVKVIPFGVDIERFHPPPPGDPREGLVGLGVVVRHKRWDIFAAAARAARLPSWVIGRVEDPTVRARALELNPDLRFLGEVPSQTLSGQLGRAKVYVHPSDMELASVATVQAMACGLPVVGSDLLSDIVTHGVNGFLVDHSRPFEERVAKTAEYVELLVHDEATWRAMSARARATAVEEHAWDRVARKLSDFYSSVAASTPGR